MRSFVRRLLLVTGLLLCLASTAGCYPWDRFSGTQAGCDAGFAHCPGTPSSSDGGAQVCETPLDTAENCGACGVQCTARCGGEGCTTPVELALGSDHTCARMSDGTVTCWGLNSQGQLGLPLSTPQSPKPLQVPGVSEAVGLVAGHELSCALIDGGTVRCWGRNNEGQLGAGDAGVTSRPEALQVMGLTDATEIWGANANVCARRREGSLSCWGSNSSGQVSLGLGKNVNLPLPITGLPDAGLLQVANAREAACALYDGGAVWCWGRNVEGQLGTGSTGAASAPVQALGLTGTKRLAAGARHVCALVEGDAALCWGSNDVGQLGAGDAGTVLPSPTPISGPRSVVQLTAAEDVTCGVRAGDDTTFCWGDNTFGQLGTLAQPSSNLPVAIPGTAFVQVRTGGNHTCGLSAAGNVWCWGQNTFGQLGIGEATTENVPVPTLVKW